MKDEHGMGVLCPGCSRIKDPAIMNAGSVGIEIQMGREERTTSVHYCPDCVKKIAAVDPEVLDERIEALVKDVVQGNPPPSLDISEGVVREIAGNLGASKKLSDALVESIFGPNWTGEVPQGARMNRYTNRDRLVAFVAARLNDLWTLEA